jgi:hypothetical protein
MIRHADWFWLDDVGMLRLRRLDGAKDVGRLAMVRRR